MLPRHHHTLARRAWAALAGVLAVICALLVALPSQAAPAPDHTAATDGFGAPTRLTLVSGDVLQVREGADGQLAVASEDRGEGQAFARFTDAAGDLNVVPAALLPLLPERLDPRLFNISGLIRDGYGTRTVSGAAGSGAGRGMPLIVTYAAEPIPVPGLTVQRELSSVGGAAAILDADNTGALGAALTEATTARFLTGVEKIWLDAPMSASLDESVPQIGAPTAWEQGFDGTGVTIAVVDTGIDESHPDLAGRVVASELFAEADSTTDVFGHGTHVASIAAGDGAASDGRYSGVAYGADLVNAKVLDDYGFGLESWVIAGMEWAAIDQDADVINMSLSGGPSDGSDPVSQAVDTLTAEEGALFVTAAGNFGGGPETVEGPAAAASALAVGAVDKSDQLAYFSAWGPVLDGTAVKPEIVAPGVDITAARAAGSEIGLPVGEDYMELSGTSMAAPHVAGAAALLLDANPGWTWAELKNALVTSAADVGSDVYQQGGGRVDVAAALEQAVHSDLATIDLGALEYPHDDGESSTVDVTLTNAGGTDLLLNLAATARNVDGDPAPDTMLALGTSELVLGPGDAKTVAVTFDPETGPIGLFSGELTVTTEGSEALHIPLAFEKEPELVDLDVSLVVRDSAVDMYGLVAIENVDDPTTYFELIDVFGGDQAVSARVPLGTYSVSWLSFQYDGASLDIPAVIEPQLAIAANTALELDSNDTNEITVDVGAPAETTDLTVGVYRKAASHDRFGFQASFGGSGYEMTHAYVNETSTVTVGDFEFFSSWSLTDGPESRYDLIFPEPDQVPADVAYTVGDDDVGLIHNDFHADVTPRTYYDGRIFFRPYSDFGFGVLLPVEVPLQRIDRVTADDTRWLEVMDIGDVNSFAPMDGALTTYAPGSELSQSWVEAPARPALTSLYRDGDLLFVYVPPWTDQDDNPGYEAYTFEGEPLDQIEMTLSADGVVVGESAASYGQFTVPAGSASYELTLDASRDAEWWLHSTQTSTTWWFTSETTSEGDTVPLAVLDYDIDLGLLNETDAPNLVTFTPAKVRGAPEITELTAAWSIDDGATWEPLDLGSSRVGSFQATVPVPATCDPSCYVSLQVAAGGEAGPVLSQEVLRAYTARYVAPPPTTPPPTTVPPTSAPPTTGVPTTVPPTGTVSGSPGTPTTTLPGTGGDDTLPLAGLGVGLLALGGVAVAIARRRLTVG